MDTAAAIQEFSFVTDTATLCVYDLSALSHRLANDADWWCSPEDDLAELNRGNAAFIGLGTDGRFNGAVFPPDSFAPTYSVRLSCPSGRVFIGAGEEVTSDGLEPQCLRGGVFFSVPQGTCILQVARADGGKLLLSFSPANGVHQNSFLQPLRLAS